MQFTLFKWNESFENPESNQKQNTTKYDPPNASHLLTRFGNHLKHSEKGQKRPAMVKLDVNIYIQVINL